LSPYARGALGQRALPKNRPSIHSPSPKTAFQQHCEKTGKNARFRGKTGFSEPAKYCLATELTNYVTELSFFALDLTNLEISAAV
jgi:hypothetical protein